ncbi:hypothetical protein BGZ49_001558 [Haplosporangium sp. Z 27]|nr:hypothetical protein BGZ49_001558 [Haplosporangium sp. Z 27]
MMVPDPMCPDCHGEFVEKIESENDPRTFIQSETGEDDQQDPALGEPINIDDLFRLFQVISSPQFATQQQQRQQQQQQQQEERERPNSMFNGGSTSFVFSSGPMGPIFTTSSGEPLSEQSQSTEHRAETEARSTEQSSDGQQQRAAQWNSPPSIISGLLGRLGIELQYSTDPAALQGAGLGGFIGGMGSNGASFFPLVGNPGDYAWGQGGLDDIITRMMELQNRQNGPVGATDEIIDNIPHHKLTPEEQVSDNNAAQSEGNSSGSGGSDSTTSMPGSFPSSTNTNSRGGNSSNNDNDGHQGEDSYPAMESLD